MIKTDNFAKVDVDSAAQLRDWLETHHTQEASIWLVTQKKHMGAGYVSVSEILDEVICFGWIDGIRRKLDADRTMQLLSPRKVQHWAKTYKDRAARLQTEGRMAPAGLAAIKTAQQNGLWSKMDDVDALIFPPDLMDALSGNAVANDNFAAANASYKRNVLRWIKLAKTDETRKKRVTTVIDTAFRNDRIPQM